MAEDNIIGWFTVNGQHIPIKEGQTKDEAFKERQLAQNKEAGDNKNAEDRRDYKLTSQTYHKQQIKELEKDSYQAGTYDLSTMKTVEYDRGYQVTFCQIGDKYSDREYAERCNEFLSASSDSRTSAGKFEGTPEVSFHVSSREKAIALGRKYNQISIYDWATGNCIDTGGTGRRK